MPNSKLFNCCCFNYNMEVYHDDDGYCRISLYEYLNGIEAPEIHLDGEDVDELIKELQFIKKKIKKSQDG